LARISAVQLLIIAENINFIATFVLQIFKVEKDEYLNILPPAVLER
jgi:hypothetical protein